MSDSVLGNEFFDDNVNNAMNDASSEDTNGGFKIERPGIYRMAVVSKKFAKDDKEFSFPMLKKSANKGSLLCDFMLEVVDGVDDVEAGAYTYSNITLAPAPGATAKKVKDTMKMLKPRLGALVGKEHVENFRFDLAWVKEYLTADFEKDGDDFVVVRDHKMKNEVMVTMVPDIYNNKPTLNITSIKIAVEGDESKVTGPSINGDNAGGFADSAEDDYNAINNLSNPPTGDGTAPAGLASMDEF